MVKVIKDLWILTDAGIVLFNRVYDPTISAQLFGAVMTALDSYAKNIGIGNEGLNSFDIKNLRFTIVRHKNLLFIANSSKDIKERRVLDELKRISDMFFKKYIHILNKFEDWNYEISVFNDFEKDIEDALEEPIKKFWQGMVS